MLLAINSSLPWVQNGCKGVWYGQDSSLLCLPKPLVGLENAFGLLLILLPYKQDVAGSKPASGTLNISKS